LKAFWGKDFSRTKLLDNKVDENTELVVTVNGQKVDTYEKLSSQGVFSTQEFEYDTAIQNYAEFIASHARHE
jgi:flagellar hook protein FlgE